MVKKYEDAIGKLQNKIHQYETRLNNIITGRNEKLEELRKELRNI